MSPSDRFEEIFSSLHIEPILFIVSKKSCYGAPVQLNYAAMVYSLVARIVERIPTVKDLIHRLKNDWMFRLDCGFLFFDEIPSEASYSRLITKIAVTNVLEDISSPFLFKLFRKGSLKMRSLRLMRLMWKHEIKLLPKRKNQNQKWLKEKEEQETQLPLYEKPIEAQLDVSLEELRQQIPLDPQCGINKNSEGKNTFWYGYKAHLAVGTNCQYIVRSILSPGNLNDGKAAIPLLKGIPTATSFFDDSSCHIGCWL